MKKIIILSTKKDLETYMNPCRQNILREMGKAGEPVTPKYLSDRVGVSPSSIQFHLKKLEDLGLVDLHHTEQIRGITARFFALTDVDVSIGGHLNDYREEREIVLENMVRNIFDGCCKTMRNSFKNVQGMSLNEAAEKSSSDILTGISFLTDKEAADLQKIIQNYLAAHSKKRPDTHPWEYGILAYKMTQEEGADE